MTPFQVYLLIQADSILSVLSNIAFLSGAVFTVTSIGRGITSAIVHPGDITGQTHDWRMWQLFIKAQRFTALLFFPLLIVATFAPSTKTIAAMIILPKITSPAALDALGTQGEELYGLAKDALKGLSEKAHPAADSNENKR